VALHHSGWWRQTRIVKHLPDNMDGTTGLDGLTHMAEHAARLVWRQDLNEPQQDHHVKRPAQGLLHHIGGHDVHPLRQARLWT
jgi:hypothetical protein